MRSTLPFLLTLLLALPSQALDWPQLQGNPQRTGYSSENLSLPLSNAWVKGFSPERLHPQTQPIIAGGKVFIGTAMGTFYAFDAPTGAQLWKFSGAGPILHTAGTEGDKVFFGSMDGKVYALYQNSGGVAWMFDSGERTGFSTAALLAGGRLFMANRSGRVYALDPATGGRLWMRDVGAPVLMSSAFDGGRIFVPAMDMRVHAMNAADGSIAWQSAPLRGSAFKDYHPVAHGGYVFIRPMAVSASDKLTNLSLQTVGPLPDGEIAQQDAMVAAFQSQPNRKTFFVLNQSDGLEPFVLPHWSIVTMHGATCPPALDGDGKLIVPAQVVTSVGNWPGGWARLDLSRRRVTERMSLNSGGTGYGNIDENMAVSAAGRLVFLFHMQEGNAQFTGVWHADTKTWTRVGQYWTDRHFTNNTQGGGASAAAISGGMIFHNTSNNLNARRAQ